MTSNFISENLVGVILFLLRLGLTLTLLGFFWIAVKIIWQDLRKQTESAAGRTIPTLSFHHDMDGQPQSFSLNEIYLGRDPGCDVTFMDELVSGRHARCYYRNKQWWLEDENSSNGTLLNGIPVETPIVITSGDELILGSTKLTISFRN